MGLIRWASSTGEGHSSAARRTPPIEELDSKPRPGESSSIGPLDEKTLAVLHLSELHEGGAHERDKPSLCAMTDHPQASPERLDEIRRLASIAEAEDRAAQATMARKRKVFGPLTYGTLVIAAIVTVYTGALQVGQFVERVTTRSVVPDPARVVAASVAQLQESRWETRAAAVNSIGSALVRYGPGEEMSGFRDEALQALRKALADEGAPVRAGAADVLGKSPPFAKLAKQELLVALTDTDPTVRLAAAAALLQIKDDSTVAALQTLSELLTDPIPSSERMSVFSVMTSEGSAGRDAAVKSVASMLSSHDVLLRKAAIDCVSALGPDAPRLGPALEPFLSGEDREMRYGAAIATARVTEDGEKLAARVIAILEDAVNDSALGADLRESALQELSRLSPTSLGRCGRELGRQLDHPNYNARLDAATLLHMIDPAALAVKYSPEN